MIQVTSGHQREVWAEYHSNTPQSREYRRLAGEQFREMFPDGHNTSIRNEIADLAAKLTTARVTPAFYSDLMKIHPRAWELILTYGRDYRPMSFRRFTPQEATLQPEPRKCFKNAVVQMELGNRLRSKDQQRLTYVEGIAIGPLSKAILHAWNGRGFSGRCFDWSLYAKTTWNRYFGVPFTQGEFDYIINNARDNPRCYQLFFGSNFESVEPLLREVLKRPRTRLCKRNGSWEWTETFHPV